MMNAKMSRQMIRRRRDRSIAANTFDILFDSSFDIRNWSRLRIQAERSQSSTSPDGLRISVGPFRFAALLGYERRAAPNRLGELEDAALRRGAA